MRFRLGINYWPAKSAMRWWQRFDPAEIERDFALLRSAGFDSARIFLLWEDFQPEPGTISRSAIMDLIAVADIAHQNGLQIMPTLFTGHMSGVNWIPYWALEDDTDPTSRFRVVCGDQVSRRRLRNWYGDSEIRSAQALLARETATALVGHPALWAYDFGNENSNCVIPLTHDEALVWLREMTEAVRSADDKTPITIGLHMEDLEEDRRLGPKEAATVCEFLCMHGYPLYARWADGPTDAMLLPFLGSVTRWLGGKDVLFQEYGAPSVDRKLTSKVGASGHFVILDDETVARYLTEATSLLHSFGFNGAMLWCFTDYAESLWNEEPFDQAVHERYFGLWRSDGTAKPAVAAIKAVFDGERTNAADDIFWIDIKRDEFYQQPRENLKRLYGRFRRSFHP